MGRDKTRSPRERVPDVTEHVPEQRTSVKKSEAGCGSDHRALFSVPSRANMNQWIGLVKVRCVGRQIVNGRRKCHREYFEHAFVVLLHREL